MTEIPGPPAPPFTPTSLWEANYCRSYGVEMCADNDLDEVEFTYATQHQFEQRFTVNAEGFMSTTMSLEAVRDVAESKAIHG